MKNLIVTILFVWVSGGVFAELWAQVSARSLGFDKSASREIFQLSTAPPASFDSTSVEEDEEANPLIGCKKPPRIYHGITTAITTGWLLNYEPTNLAGNLLTGISHETNTGYSTGVRIDYVLGNVKFFKSFITFDLMFGRLGFQYSAQDSVQSTTSEKMLGQYQLTTTASTFTLNAQYTHLVPGTLLGITAGITTSYIFNVEHSYTVTADKVILPSALLINTSNNGNTVQYADPSTTDVNRLQLGLVAGLRYDILLGRSALTPFAQFEYGLNGILNGGKERPMQVRVGLAWWFAL